MPHSFQPGDGVDLRDGGAVAAVFDRAATLNLETPSRRRSVVDLPSSGEVFMTGDLHDHAVNYQKILKLTDLRGCPGRHLILHEVVHGPHRVNGMDLSIRTLAKVAVLKTTYPDRVHQLLSNHELAQLTGEVILKGGVSVVEAFNTGVEFLYTDQAGRVREAMDRYLRSLPLAVRCPNGVLLTHSLPSANQLKRFDPAVLNRTLSESELMVGGSGYSMVWGRGHTQEVADKLGQAWGVNQFVMGHQPAEMGHTSEGDSMLILASDHDHGVVLPIDLGRRYTQPELIDRLVPLASVVL